MGSDAPKTGRAAAEILGSGKWACETCAVWQSLAWDERCPASKNGFACDAWSRRTADSLAVIIAGRDKARQALIQAVEFLVHYSGGDDCTCCDGALPVPRCDCVCCRSVSLVRFVREDRKQW